jgi:hypothetical protein
VFTAAGNWWWVPIVAPVIGGVLGGWTYDVFIGHRFEVVKVHDVEGVQRVQ